MPPAELRKYADACNLTFTKDCSSTSGGSFQCEIRDKHGKLVRTYTTDAP